MSIWTALGASRAQLVRQWLTECLALALMGGLAGLLAAAWITKALLYFVPETDRGYLAFHPDGKMLLFTAALTLAAGFFFGLLPALRLAIPVWINPRIPQLRGWSLSFGGLVTFPILSSSITQPGFIPILVSLMV